MSIQRARVIVNPAAGGRSTYREWPLIRKRLTDIGLLFDYVYTEGTGHAIELAREAANTDYRYIIAVGGDGTLNEVVNVAAKTDINVGMIAGGSACDSHKSHGIPRDFDKAFEIISKGYTERFPVGLAKGDTDRYFTEMINGAFIGETSSALNDKYEWAHGEIGYALVAMRVAMGFKPIPSKITIDNDIVREVDLSSFAVAITDTISDFNFIPGNHPRMGDFGIILVKDFKRLKLVNLIIKAISGKHVKSKNVEILRGKHVLIESERPHTWESEGEIPSRKTTTMEVQYIPNAVNFIIPEGWKYGYSLKDRKNALKKVLKNEKPFF